MTTGEKQYAKLMILAQILILIALPIMGLSLCLIGSSMNGLAVYVNHGAMPVLVMNDATRTILLVDPNHSALTIHSNLILLCDIIPMPLLVDHGGWATFSIGDVTIFTGQILYALTLPTFLIFVLRAAWRRRRRRWTYSATYLPALSPGQEDPSRTGFPTFESAEEYIAQHACNSCKAERQRAINGVEDEDDNPDLGQPSKFPACFCEWFIEKIEAQGN